MPTPRSSALLAYVKAETDLLDTDLYVIDVGCSQGLAAELRQYEPGLAGIGFDPLIAEVERLTGIESNAKIQYVAAWIEPVDGALESKAPHDGWRARSSSTAVLELKRAAAK